MVRTADIPCIIYLYTAAVHREQYEYLTVVEHIGGGFPFGNRSGSNSDKYSDIVKLG